MYQQTRQNIFQAFFIAYDNIWHLSWFQAGFVVEKVFRFDKDLSY